MSGGLRVGENCSTATPSRAALGVLPAEVVVSRVAVPPLTLPQLMPALKAGAVTANTHMTASDTTSSVAPTAAPIIAAVPPASAAASLL